MKIQQLIEEQMNEFDTVAYNESVYGNPTETEEGLVHYREFINTYTRKLIEALGSELIGHDTAVMWAQSDNALRARQRIKLKEILQNIK